MNQNAAKLSVLTADDTIHKSSATANLLLDVPSYFPTSRYVATHFPYIIFVVGKICDANCRLLFDKHKLSVLDHSNRPILTGWYELSSSLL